MRGEILELNGTTGGGVIADEYGARYTFDGAAVRTPLSVGDRVFFSAVNGVGYDVQAAGPEAQPQPASPWTQPPLQPEPVSAGFNLGTALFSFNGRLRRSHYWATWGILFAVGLVTSLIPFLNFFVALALLWPNLAKDVKRLHDIGVSGWWVAAPYLAGVVGYGYFFVVLAMAEANNPGSLENAAPERILAIVGPAFGLFCVMIVVQLGFWLWFGIADSRRGQNAWGANPKGEA